MRAVRERAHALLCLRWLQRRPAGREHAQVQARFLVAESMKMCVGVHLSRI